MKRVYITLLTLISGFAPMTMAQSPEAGVTVSGAGDAAGPVIIRRGMAAPSFNTSSLVGDIGHHANVVFVSSGMMLGKLFTPDLIMRNRERLNLTDQQVETIKDEMRNFQSGIVDIQWDLNEAQSNLEKELNNEKIDVNRALALLDGVMQAENDLKRSHMALLIRIRNALDVGQIAELEKLGPFHLGELSPAAPGRHVLMRQHEEIH